jgi:hypothetical protein
MLDICTQSVCGKKEASEYKILPRQLTAYDNASQESGPQPLVGMQDSARTQVCLRNQVPVTHVFPDTMNILPRSHELLKQ